MDGLSPDYSKRDYLLPAGCKDLIDVLRLESRQPPGIKLLELKGAVSVKDLAVMLGCRPFRIVADLLELKIMAHVDQSVTYEVAAKLARKYGFVARRDF